MTKHPKEADRLKKIVEAFPKVTVTVLGDLVADEFIFGEISRVSREAPVLILKHRERTVVPGLLFLLLQSATGFRWRSLMVAALFAVHPINVESVAWAAERKNVLSVLFFLLALQAYVWYTREPALLRYAAVFLLFALGLLSKSRTHVSISPLPVGLLAAMPDWFPGGFASGDAREPAQIIEGMVGIGEGSASFCSRQRARWSP